MRYDKYLCPPTATPTASSSSWRRTPRPASPTSCRGPPRHWTSTLPLQPIRPYSLPSFQLLTTTPQPTTMCNHVQHTHVLPTTKCNHVQPCATMCNHVQPCTMHLCATHAHNHVQPCAPMCNAPMCSPCAPCAMTSPYNKISTWTNCICVQHCISLPFSASLCISPHPSAFLCIPLHLSAFLCVPLHPSAFLRFSLYFSAYPPKLKPPQTRLGGFSLA